MRRKMHARSTKRSRGGGGRVVFGPVELGAGGSRIGDTIGMGDTIGDFGESRYEAGGGRRSVRRRRGARRSRRGGGHELDLIRDQKGGMSGGGLAWYTYAKGMEGVRGVATFGGEARAMGGGMSGVGVAAAHGMSPRDAGGVSGWF
jgi:hypothetical protein